MEAELADEFFAAIVAGDFSGASAVARRSLEQGGLPFLYEKVIAPALARVGDHWHEGKLSVADEHIATAITQSVLASFYPTFPWKVDGPKGIVACVSGERHELGARMAADLLSCDGWNILFVGGDVPLEALLALVARESPRLIGLSVGLPDRLSDYREAFARLKHTSPGSKLLVGGRAVASGALSPSDLKADLAARSAQEAVEAVREWKK